MEAKHRFVILIIVLFIATVPAQSANQQDTVQISSTHTASCIVKITFDPLVLSLDNLTIDYLLHSTSIGGKVTREVLDISPDQASDIFKVEALGSTTGRLLPEPSSMRRSAPTSMNEYELMKERERMEQDYSTSTTGPGPSGRIPTASTTISSPAAEKTILFKLQVDLPENVKPAAEEFMYALVNSLRSTINTVFEDYKLRIENQLKLAEKEANGAESDLRDKQKTLREISRSYILNRDQILADIYRLRQEVRTAKLNQASNEIIINTTTQKISEIQNKITEQLEKDTIINEYQKIIEISDEFLIEAEKEAKDGKISAAQAAQIDEIKEKVFRAKIEQARRRESLSISIGGNLLESLNKELADRSIQATDQEASLISLEKQLVEAESLLAKADDYELLTIKVDVAKQNLQESILWRDRVSRQIRLLQSPMVSILGGE
jgi:hypothetical protein